MKTPPWKIGLVLFLLGWVGFAAVGSIPAARAQLCMPPEALARYLGQFGEAPAGAGITGAGALIALWRNRDTGTWSLAFTGATGLSCLVWAGQDWTDRAPDSDQGDSL